MMQSPKQQQTVFVVETNILYRQLIARQLEKVNCIIHYFRKAEDCIAVLGNRKPDVILVDDVAEGKINGLDAVKAIRALNTGVKILVLSNQPDLQSAENTSRYGQFEWMEKSQESLLKLEDKLFPAVVPSWKSPLPKQGEKTGPAASLAHMVKSYMDVRTLNRKMMFSLTKLFA